MELTQPHFERIAHLFPRQRGNVSLSHLAVLNAILYVAEQGCKWRGLPASFGNWHTIYTRMNRWAKSGVLDRVFAELQRLGLIRTAGGGDVARQHGGEGAPGRDGRAEKNGPQAIGKSRGGWSTKIHLVAADDRSAIGFSLSGGQAGDAPEGRALLTRMVLPDEARCLVMDKAYEGDETRQLVADLGLEPVVPPKANRLCPWDYDRELYKRRNEVERLFRRLKRFRRVCTRFDKLDVVFTFFIYFALIVDALESI